MSRTKIVITIGPSSCTPRALQSLVEAGADVARLNGSHGDLKWHADAINLVRQVAPQMPVLLDLPGRKIRTLTLEHEPAFSVGDYIVLTTIPGHNGQEKVSVSDANLHSYVGVGDAILADDGQVRFTVEKVTGRDIVCRAETDGVLHSRKGLNLPGVLLQTPLVTERDRELLAFAARIGVDFVGISFVENANHVRAIRSMIGKNIPRIVSKIENQGALERSEEIIDASDAIMIDRGDLSAETGLYNVALLQKQILSAARKAGKPAIVATELLHSMVNNPFPTKAEISDISNAVLDGASAIMLSNETAIGRFPVEAVATMHRTAQAAADYMQSKLDQRDKQADYSVPQAIGDAIAIICRRLPITKIVAITLSGFAARMVAAGLPRQPILAVSNDPASVRSFRLLAGTEGFLVDIPFSRTSTDHIPKCLEALWRCGELIDGDLVLVTSVGYPKSGNRMNLIQTHNVSDLRESLGWSLS